MLPSLHRSELLAEDRGCNGIRNHMLSGRAKNRLGLGECSWLVSNGQRNWNFLWCRYSKGRVLHRTKGPGTGSE